MSSAQRECKLHKDIGPGFCLRHGLYCCPSCHKKTSPDCSVSNIDHAASSLQHELESLVIDLHNALQSCESTKTTLHEQVDDAQHQCDEAIDHVTEFCAQLQSTIDSFRQQGIETIRALTANRTDTIKEQLQKSEDLEYFLVELNERVLNDTSEDAMTRNADQKSYGGHVDLVKLNTNGTDLRDGLAQVESNECVSGNDHFSVYIQDGRSINQHLANQLNVLCDSIGKSPEGCSKTLNSDRPVSPPQASWKVLTDQDNDVHSLYSGAGVARDNCTPESVTLVTMGDSPAPDSFGEVTKGDNRVPDSFREVSRIFHRGTGRVVRFARSSDGLYILIASTGPCRISKVDENGRTLVTEKTNTWISDISVRGGEVFAAAGDRTIRVYRLADLHLMRHIPTIELCNSIVRTDHDLVVTYPVNDNERYRVCRLSETGHVTRESSCKITRASGLTMTSDGDRIMVSDGSVNKIIVLSAALKLITKVRIREICNPCGLCVIGESVFVACDDSVIELDSHGRYRRTVLDEAEGVVDPLNLSYDSQSRKLVVSSNTQSEKIIVLIADDDDN